MAMLISFDKTSFQKCIEGKKWGIYCSSHTFHTAVCAYSVQRYNLTVQAEDKINNKSNYLYNIRVTILPQACEESHTSSPQTLGGFVTMLSSVLYLQWIRVIYSFYKHNCYPRWKFISPGQETWNHFGPKKSLELQGWQQQLSLYYFHIQDHIRPLQCPVSNLNKHSLARNNDLAHRMSSYVSHGSF